MATRKHLDTSPRNPKERKLWFYFLAFRTGCALVALTAVFSIPLAGSILMVALLLAILASIENCYKSSIYWLRQREKQRARKLHWQKAEEERLERLRQLEEIQQAAAGKHFDPKPTALGKQEATGAGPVESVAGW